MPIRKIIKILSMVMIVMLVLNVLNMDIRADDSNVEYDEGVLEESVNEEDNEGNEGNEDVEQGNEEKESLFDVEEYETGYKEMKWAVEEGFIDLFEDGTFRKNQKVTEAQFMSLLYLYLGMDDVDSEFEELKKERESVVAEDNVDKLENEKNKEKVILDEEGYKEVDLNNVYERLRSVGIVSSGTNYKEKRDMVITIEEAINILIMLYDEEEFIKNTDRIDEFYVESLKEYPFSIRTNKELLTRGSASLIISNFDKKNLEIKSNIVLDPELGSHIRYYFGDWNKRMFLYYPTNNLIVSVTELKEELEKEKDYYNKITGDSLEIDEEEDNYLVNVSSVDGQTIDFYGYALAKKDVNGTSLDKERHDFVALRGDAKISTLVTGEDIENIQLVIGKNNVVINLNNLKEFPGNRFYTDRGRGMEWNNFYVGDNVSDTYDQVERLIYLQNKNRIENEED